MLSAVGTSEGNGYAEDPAAAMTFVKETLAALDSNIQALILRQRNQDNNRQMLHSTIQERASKPVVELLARWIEASRLPPQNGGVDYATAALGGVAAVPRILYRESMRDIAAKLRQRVRNDLVDDNEISNILGSCLLEIPETLTSRLHGLLKRKSKDELLFLWQACSPILKAQSDHEIRTNIISLFLTTSLANRSDSKSQSDELQAVLAEIYSLLPKPTPLPVYHSLLSLYAGINTISSPDHQETGNTVLSSQASLQNLLATWSRMKAEQVTPDIKAYTILITGLGKKGDYQGLQRVWEELVNDAACKALWQKEEGTGSSTLALSLFDYVCETKSAYQPDMFTVNIVLRHYARKKDLDAIIRLMDRLPGFRLTPDLVTYTTLIGGLLDAGRPDTAEGILNVMQKTGVHPNAYVYSLLIADLAKRGTQEAMKSAEALLQQMKAVGLKATAVTWTALASGYFRAAMVREGLGAIKRSQDKGVELTRVSYNMVLRSILYSDMDAVPAAEIEHFFRGKLGASQRHPVIIDGNTDATLLLLQNMIDNRIEPDLDTWQLVLDSLSRQEKWTEADSVIQLMYSRRYVVKEGSLLARVVQQIRNREKTRRR
ncbi:hypothetical protein QFC21_002441 [Naganishia friedmannii]|uniref:Uncharacterized protein n=1 Tax=Naganishia friedmannii TaxID=89922 RepID=A0ACC2VXR6_9TREE|nr:hypothetical protein QFC21_002441 [Naganishia friedmannii]